MNAPRFRPVYGLMGFRVPKTGKAFAAVAPSRGGGGILDGREAEEIPAPSRIVTASPADQEVWARGELAKRGIAFHGLYVSDIR